MERASSCRFQRSPGWKTTASGCRISSPSTAAELIKLERCTACSARLEQSRGLPNGLPRPDIRCGQNCLNQGARFSEEMLLIPAILFVTVSVAAFSFLIVLDQRSARARLIRHRVASAQAPGASSEAMALLRDEMLSRIPAFDTLLRRSERVSRLQILLEQAGLSMRAGNLLIVCLLSAAVGAVAGYVLAQPLPAQETLLFTGTGVGL